MEEQHPISRESHYSTPDPNTVNYGPGTDPKMIAPRYYYMAPVDDNRYIEMPERQREQFIDYPPLKYHEPKKQFIDELPMDFYRGGRSNGNSYLSPSVHTLAGSGSWLVAKGYEGPSVAAAQQDEARAQAALDAALAANAQNVASVMTAGTAERSELRAQLAALRQAKEQSSAALARATAESAVPPFDYASKLGKLALGLSGVTFEEPKLLPYRPQTELLALHQDHLRQAKGDLAAEQAANGADIVSLMHGDAADRIAAHGRLAALRTEVSNAQLFVDIVGRPSPKSSVSRLVERISYDRGY